MEIPDSQPPKTWPEQGSIEFEWVEHWCLRSSVADTHSHLDMRYRPELELILKDVCVKIQGGERVGICGRTGAGKSSLAHALFRIIEPASGSILIDGINTTTIGLQDLRSILSIIPQDPQLFEGSLRANVDPTDSATDQDMWQALSQAYLKDHIMHCMDGTLNAKIAEGGSSESVARHVPVHASCASRPLGRPASAGLFRPCSPAQNKDPRLGRSDQLDRSRNGRSDAAYPPRFRLPGRHHTDGEHRH